jgi:hypothetical protein
VSERKEGLLVRLLCWFGFHTTEEVAGTELISFGPIEVCVCCRKRFRWNYFGGTMEIKEPQP